MLILRPLASAVPGGGCVTPPLRYAPGICSMLYGSLVQNIGLK